MITIHNKKEAEKKYREEIENCADKYFLKFKKIARTAINKIDENDVGEILINAGIDIDEMVRLSALLALAEPRYSENEWATESNDVISALAQSFYDYDDTSYRHVARDALILHYENTIMRDMKEHFEMMMEEQPEEL